VLNRLNGDSELIVLTAAGAPLSRIARPLILLAVVVSVAVSVVNHFAMPWSLKKLRNVVMEVRSNLIQQVIQPGKFSTPEHRLTFHIRDRSLKGEIEGLMLHDARDDKQTTTYLAERGVIVKQGGNSYIFMNKGHILRRGAPNTPAEIIKFETYAVDLARFERKAGVIELKPRERYFDELVNPDPKDSEYKSQPGFFRSELHERFASALYPFAFVALALAFVGQAQSTRQNRGQMLIFAIVFAIVARLGGLAANNVVAVTPNALVLLYGIPLLIIALCLLRMRANARPRGGLSLWDRMTMAIEDMFARTPKPALPPMAKGVRT
jgi:lipopolysaccharide export system permease protein